MIDHKDVSKVVIARVGDSILEVSRILRDTRARHLVVIDQHDAPVGIISSVDINNRVVAEEKDAKSLKAKETMTPNIDVIDLETGSYQQAYEKMINRSTYSIPVVKQGKLLGMLEFTKCIQRLAQQQHDTNTKH